MSYFQRKGTGNKNKTISLIKSNICCDAQIVLLGGICYVAHLLHLKSTTTMVYCAVKRL